MNRKRYLLLIGTCLLAGALLAGNVTAQEPENSLEVQLASPGQGEIFYAASSGVMTSVPISGRVVSYDTPVDLETVNVTLTVMESNGAITEIQTPVSEDGHFQVWATINARGAMPILDDHLTDICLTCHVEGEITIPNNTSQLLVHASTPDGLTGSAVREIRLDRSTFLPLEVRVLGLPEGTRGAQVTASTTVYEWRPRSFYGSVQDGQARVDIEDLAYADLAYRVELLPVVVGDTRYEAEPVTFTLPASATEPPAVTLTALPLRGTISGRVVDGMSRDGVSATILALDLLTGAGRTVTTAEDGTFELADLPVSEHALQVQSAAGFHLPGRYDLREEHTQAAILHLIRGGPATLHGTVTLDGRPLPFAQAAVADLATTQADPLTGAFEVPAVPAEGDIAVEITAAGCYSRQLTTAERDLGTLALTLHPDTTVLTQGNARLYLPAATQATHSDGIVHLQQGVVWVTGGSGTGGQSFEVVVGDYRVSGAGADYAIEALPTALPRLYVSAGEVTAARADGAPVSVEAGQTLTLTGASPSPADLAPGAGALLRTLGGSVTRFELEPPLAERITAAGWQATGTVAKILLAGAYTIGYVIAPATLVVSAGLWLRRRLRPRRE